jgi:hypothetical protein
LWSVVFEFNVSVSVGGLTSVQLHFREERVGTALMKFKTSAVLTVPCKFDVTNSNPWWVIQSRIQLPVAFLSVPAYTILHRNEVTITSTFDSEFMIILSVVVI